MFLPACNCDCDNLESRIDEYEHLLSIYKDAVEEPYIWPDACADSIPTTDGLFTIEEWEWPRTMICYLHKALERCYDRIDDCHC